MTSRPINIPVETVIANNEHGYFGLCESLESPRSYDGELFDSTAASKFFKDFINLNDEPSHTGTRTSKRKKGKEATIYKTVAYQQQQKNHPKNRHKKQQITIPYEADDSDASEDETKEEIHRRKKSDDKSRAFERQLKEITLNSVIQDTASNSEDSPVSAIKIDEKIVDSSSEFKCLNSKCVIGSPTRRCHLDSIVDHEPSLPFTSYQLDQLDSEENISSRSEFYNTFSLLLRIGNKEKSDFFLRQKSQEELLWQTNLMDLVWLELQAWHNQKTLKDEDAFLCKTRLNIPNILNSVIDYRYSSGIESLCCQPKPYLSCLKFTDTFAACSIICSRFMTHVHNANEEISELIESICYAESLYPSTKSMMENQPLYNDMVFISKFKTLCLWSNLISELHLKLRLMFSLIGFHHNCLFESRNQRPSRADSGVYSSNTHSSSPSTNGDVESKFDLSFKAYMNLDQMRSQSQITSEYKSVYHSYIEKKLRQKGGFRHMLHQLKHLLKDTQIRIEDALQPYVPQSTYASIVAKKVPVEEHTISMYFDYNLDQYTTEYHCDLSEESSKELKMFGTYSKYFQEMCLPSFMPYYIYLIHIPINIMQECISIRLSQQPKNPSLLSMQQLVLEIQEVIRGGIIIRFLFVGLMRILYCNKMLNPNISNEEMLSQAAIQIDDHLETYDNKMKEILQVYLSYVHRQLQLTQSITLDTKTIKLSFEDDWSFMKRYCGHLRGGKTLSATQFCFFTRNMLENISDNLECCIDDASTKLDDIFFAADYLSENKKDVLSIFRNYKTIFSVAREKSLRVMSFAKTLRKDLEIAAEYRLVKNCCNSWEKMFTKLYETDHSLVIIPHFKNYVMFAPGNIKGNKRALQLLLDAISGYGSSKNGKDCDMNDLDAYLLLTYYDDVCGCINSWKGPVFYVEPCAEHAIIMSHVQVSGILVIVDHSTQLNKQCSKFKLNFGDLVTLYKSNTSCNQAVVEALKDVKIQALESRKKIADTILEVQSRFESLKTNELDLNMRYICKGILVLAYSFGFEFHRDLMWLVTCYNEDLTDGLFNFANMWMDFVMNWISRGRGIKPIWAIQGLEYLSLISNPRFTSYLSDDDFQQLKNRINATVSYVIGSANSSPIKFEDSYKRTSGIDFDLTLLHSTSFQEFPLISKRSESVISTRSEPEYCTSLDSADGGMIPVHRVRKAISLIDDHRDRILIKQNKIGKVRDVLMDKAKFVARKVTFSWQRGKKIGEGRFGKVYTAVNNNTGELIAMKEINFTAGDLKAIKSITDEIFMLEQLHHKFLVSYYGVEVHREEMYMFMELCTEGTLEYASQLGLVESTIRKYSSQLLCAIAFLHEQKIVHRDIKPANIFLSNDGNLKLGDFGCCIKLKSHATVPGELAAFVGTPAYMAPEVITQSGNDGHGRAADVWSFGCVVIEMFSGKRPWYELENSQQIMFKVGMGGTPDIPQNCSEEGVDFISKCLVHDPMERTTAASLTTHPFTKFVVIADE